MTSVIVLGPNLIDQSKGSFHVHAEHCKDIATYHGRQFADDKANPLDVNSVEEISAIVYDFEEDPSEYVNDFYVFPCVHFEEKELVHLPDPEFVPEGHVIVPGAGITVPVAKSWRVTFELYNEDLFFEMQIITSDENLSDTVSLLESVPNVRQVNVNRES